MWLECRVQKMEFYSAFFLYASILNNGDMTFCLCCLFFRLNYSLSFCNGFIFKNRKTILRSRMLLTVKFGDLLWLIRTPTHTQTHTHSFQHTPHTTYTTHTHHTQTYTLQTFIAHTDTTHIHNTHHHTTHTSYHTTHTHPNTQHIPHTPHHPSHTETTHKWV